VRALSALRTLRLRPEALRGCAGRGSAAAKPSAGSHPRRYHTVCGGAVVQCAAARWHSVRPRPADETADFASQSIEAELGGSVGCC